MVIGSRKFENFEMFCPLGAMKLGVQQKKVTASDSAKPRPHIHIFFLSQGFQIEEKFWKQSFRYLSKIKFGRKMFSLKPPPSPKNSKK